MSERFRGYELDQQSDLIGRYGERVDVYCRLYESLSGHARTAFPDAVLFLQGGFTGNRSWRDVAFLALGLVTHVCTVVLADGCQPQDGIIIAAIDNARCAVLWLRAHAA